MMIVTEIITEYQKYAYKRFFRPELSISEEVTLEGLLCMPEAYGVEEETFRFLKENPSLNVFEASQYFNEEICPQGFPTNMTEEEIEAEIAFLMSDLTEEELNEPY